ncbi:hypothetical protein HNR46_000280 [Haloferula luteola]|uniref:PEP-CTERM protein-sorting domain-containing protein n=1 Tax=Haloferula luteola TaxID=595692 RepID=A0A840V8F0_9BACT|nr:hypothetical protein [Haloferula luteola]MBB5350059.1 hypothetical protein [Haloferula luteola]
MKGTFRSGLLASLAIFAPSVYGALTLTNGDFNAAGDNQDDVTSWFDTSNGTFWQGSWQSNNAGQTPNGTGIVILGSYESGGIQNTTSADPLVGNWIYQSIGTADPGTTQLTVNFDFGQPDDDPGGRTLGITVAIYSYDGSGSFTPDENASLYTASLDSGTTGITLLDSSSFSFGPTTSADDMISSYEATLDLSSAGSQQLFLSFNNYRPANTDSWSVIDNIAITPVPEPTLSLLGSLSALGLLRRRRD